MTESPPAKHRLRWYQYGLRSLLLLMLAVGVFFGWLESRRRVYQGQAEAIEELEKLRGVITLEGGKSPLLRRLLGEDYVHVVKISLHDQRFLSGKDLEPLARLADLRELSLHGCTGLGNDGLAHLAGLTGMQRLSLHGTGISGAGLVHLKGLTELRTLSLQSVRADEGGLQCLAGMKNLEDLNLAKAQIHGPLRIRSLPKLRRLDLSEVRKVTRLELEDLPELTTLNMDYADTHELRVADLPKLTRLSFVLGSWRQQPRYNIQLEDLPNVAGLFIMSDRIDTLRLQGLNSVTEIYADLDHISDQEFHDLGTLSRLEKATFRESRLDRLPLDRWPNLKHLDLRDTPIEDSGLQGLETLMALETFYLREAPVTSETTYRLTRLPNLRNLILSSTKIGDDGAAHLGQLTSVQYLTIQRTGITDAGLAHLTRLPNVRHLDLFGNPITGAKVTKWDLPQLRELRVSETNFSADGIKGLASLRQLEDLYLDGTSDQTDVIRELRKELPKLRNVYTTAQ